MSFIGEYLILSVVGSLVVTFTRVLSSWPKWDLKGVKPPEFVLEELWAQLLALFRRTARVEVTGDDSIEDHVKDITGLAEYHETASRLADLIKQDGAGTWPPRVSLQWPAALRPYIDIYHEMAPLLPAENPSLDDDHNTERIEHFRSHFSKLLAEKVNLSEVTRLLDAADAGRWDVFPRDAYNGFYTCIAWCRHAYR
jgi:hypothetical protein